MDHISWRRSRTDFFCNQSVIESGELIGEPGDLVCHSCYYFVISDVSFMCTDFNVEED